MYVIQYHHAETPFLTAIPCTPSTLLLRDNKDNSFSTVDLCENIKIGRGKKPINNNNNNNNNAQIQIWDNNIMSKQHAIIGEVNGKVKLTAFGSTHNYA